MQGACADAGPAQAAGHSGSTALGENSRARHVQRICCEALMTDTAMSIELVRHAKAQGRDHWWGKPDRKRPLTKAGAVQAKTLAGHLATLPITRILSSPFARCMQTVEPLAERLDMPVEPADALGEAPGVPVLDGGDAWVASAWLGGRALALIDQLAAEDPGGHIVLCSHGDVIPSVMAALAGRDGLAIGDVHLKKGARFHLTFKGPKCIAAEAVPPP
jgi:broad specificity phosphatase PhoE